ncbi:MAG: YdbL family protein [Desulfobulbaceae bacterium]|nr:YdbL family protein [Desulfobulbaceae bacterium]
MKNVWWVMALCLVWGLTSGNALAADGIKARMLARVPEINALKTAGVVGENSKGYLEFVGARQEKVSLVESENADRRQVYEAIAAQQGTSSERVGQRRALQIAESAESGSLLQAADGSWRKK